MQISCINYHLIVSGVVRISTTSNRKGLSSFHPGNNTSIRTANTISTTTSIYEVSVCHVTVKVKCQGHALFHLSRHETFHAVLLSVQGGFTLDQKRIFSCIFTISIDWLLREGDENFKAGRS